MRAHGEQCVRTIRERCLNGVILFGKTSFVAIGGPFC